MIYLVVGAVALFIAVITLLFIVRSCKLKNAELKRRIYTLEQQKKEEMEKKNYRILRIYGYKYEDFIYSVMAEKHCLNSNSRCGFLDQSIRKNELINKIKYSEQFRGENPEEVIKLFEKYELISTILSEREKDGSSMPLYNIGHTLDKYANIISENDMNPYKWLENHIPK